MSVTSEEEIQPQQQEDDKEFRLKLLCLRRPTPLQKIFDSIPRPVRAVPKNGLPLWYRLALDRKLSLPKIPEGKIIFSRGKVGENIRNKASVSKSKSAVTFDISDPNCSYVSYDYEPLHDVHLKNHFKRPAVHYRLSLLRFITKDGDAICTLKEFNINRRFLYLVFMDAVHEMMRELDQKAKDDLALLRVDHDVDRRCKYNLSLEHELERRQRYAKHMIEESAAKHRLIVEKAEKQRNRMEYLKQFKEQLRIERAAKSRKQEALIRQRLAAAEELLMRRTISIIREWRKAEEKRRHRVKQIESEKKEKHTYEVLRKWNARVESQNNALAEEARLLAIYEEQFKKAVKMRMIKAFIQFYRDEQILQALKLSNWRKSHKQMGITKKMISAVTLLFEKNQSGSVRLEKDECKVVAEKVLKEAFTGPNCDYMTRLTEVRKKMLAYSSTPGPVLYVLDVALSNTVKEFTNRRLTYACRRAEQYAVSKSLKTIRISRPKSKHTYPSLKLDKVQKVVTIHVDEQETAQDETEKKAPSPTASRYTTGSQFMKILPRRKVYLGESEIIAGGPGGEINEGVAVLKSCKDRPPTPLPKEIGFVELVFEEKLEDTLGPVPISGNMPERTKLLELLAKLAKILRREVYVKVELGLDVILSEVTLPRIRRELMWDEMIDSLTKMVLEEELGVSEREINVATSFLARRVLLYLKACMKRQRQEEKALEEARKWEQILNKRKKAQGPIVEEEIPTIEEEKEEQAGGDAQQQIMQQ